MKIAIGNDHAAVEMKQEIMAYLEEKGYEVIRNTDRQSERLLSRERQTAEF